MPDEPKQRSTESYGLGQSGYTAGRRANDLALELELEPRNQSVPRQADEPVLDDGTDDRFFGRGGPPWSPTPDEDEARRASR